MVNYQLGKIYKIVSDKTDKVYVGSTTKKTLAQRMAQHRNNFKRFKQGLCCNVTSFNILELGDAKIILIENFPCNNKDELHKRERYWIEQMECVNKYRPTRNAKEYYEDNKNEISEYRKKYYDTNKDTISLKKKQHYEENKTSVLNKNKQYYEKNKENILQQNHEYQKEYRKKNREVLLNKQKGKQICECGLSVSNANIAKHRKTLKHEICEINKLAKNIKDKTKKMNELYTSLKV